MYDYGYSEYRELVKLKKFENNLYNCHFTQLTKYHINFIDNNGVDRISFSNPIKIKGKNLLCENLFLEWDSILKESFSTLLICPMLFTLPN